MLDPNTSEVTIYGASLVGAVIYAIRLLIVRGAKDVTNIRSDNSIMSYVDDLKEDNALLRSELARLSAEHTDLLIENGSLKTEIARARFDSSNESLLADMTAMKELSRSNAALIQQILLSRNNDG